MRYKFFLAIISLFFMENALAVPCKSNTSGLTRIFLNYNNGNFSNNIGEIQESYEKTSTAISVTGCDQREAIYFSSRLNDEHLIPYPARGEGAFIFKSHPEIGIKIFMGIQDAAAGGKILYHLMPFDNVSNNCAPTGAMSLYCRTGVILEAGREYKIQVFLTKRLVGGFKIPSVDIGYLYGASEPNESSDIMLARIHMAMDIIVPENCVIEAGELIQIDFGKIKSSDFYDAGPGNIALNTNKATSNVLFDCIGISAGIGLNASIQAVNVENDYIISSNPSIGFRFSDQDGNVLQPNNTNSGITSIIDQNQKVNFPFQVWPIFIGGNRPTTGVVKGEAFLRLDFE